MMRDDDRRDRNRATLQECYQTFRTPLAYVLASLESQGFHPRIQCAWRSATDQTIAYNAGMSHVRFGFHNITAADGTPEALAADVLDDDHPLNPSRDYVMALARTARARGLETGILWDLPPNMREPLDNAITHHQPWDGKIGFDPTHVEVTGLTIQQAQHGQRPTNGAL